MPPVGNGTTLAVSSDLHCGERSFTAAWLSKAARDLVYLQANHHAHIITGDMSDWSVPGAGGYTTDDATYIAWRAVVEAGGKPYLDIPGNHDLEDHTAEDTNTYRTSAQWAAAMGRSTASGVLDVGHLRVIAVVPDIWRNVDSGDPHQNFTLSSDMFDWMTAQVADTDRPIVVAAHLPPRAHYGEGFSAVHPEEDVEDWVSDNAQVIGWVSGHQHADPLDPATWAKVVTVGTRDIYSINVPAVGGRSTGTSSADHQYLSRNGTAFVTFTDTGTCEVRIRDHKSASWYPGPYELAL